MFVLLAGLQAPSSKSCGRGSWSTWWWRCWWAWHGPSCPRGQTSTTQKVSLDNIQDKKSVRKYLLINCIFSLLHVFLKSWSYFDIEVILIIILKTDQMKCSCNVCCEITKRFFCHLLVHHSCSSS